MQDHDFFSANGAAPANGAASGNGAVGPGFHWVELTLCTGGATHPLGRSDAIVPVARLFSP